MDFSLDPELANWIGRIVINRNSSLLINLIDRLLFNWIDHFFSNCINLLLTNRTRYILITWVGRLFTDRSLFTKTKFPDLNL